MKRIAMIEKEAKRFTIIRQVLEKQITQKRAAKLLGLSVPRIKVLCRAFRN
jgi:predicted XRE-type DNA-binding protein